MLALDWYLATVALVVLAALIVVLILDHRRCQRKPPKEPRWFRVAAICAFFAVIVFPFAVGLPIMIADIGAARQAAQRQHRSQQSASAPTTTQAATHWADSK
jgi:uncharacterized membrane protein YdcZ (DUF606 family)